MQIAQLLYKQKHTEREHTFFSQHKRPLSTPKQNCKMQFFLLSNTSMFTFSLFLCQLCSFRTKTHTFMRTPTRTHTNTHAAVFLALTLSLSDMKLSLGDGKRQQRERKYKCSANGFCGDVTVAASVGDRWKR